MRRLLLPLLLLLTIAPTSAQSPTVVGKSLRLTDAPCTITSTNGTPDKLVLSGCSTVTTDAATNLTISPTGDLVTDPVGNDVLPASNYDINIGMLSKKYLTLHAAELWVETLVAQNTIATIGGRVLVAPTNTLTADLSDSATSITVKYNNFSSGDRIYMEADSKVEFMAITSSASGSGPYTYSVTRNLDGSGANAWYAGDALLDTGTTGDGFIDLYSTSGILSTGSGPSIVGNVRTGTTYNAYEPRWAIGNLNGLYGYSTSIYGAAFGDDDATNVTVDATNGFRIRSGTDDILSADTSGNLSMDGDLEVGTDGVIHSAGASAYATGTGFWINGGTTTEPTVTYLVVGGGGGGSGGADAGGGGGAGGFVTSTAGVTPGTAITVTVGPGGAGGTSGAGSSGTGSAFGPFTADGGGGGGYPTAVNGKAGGSGGGGSSISGTGGTATSGQGHAGGSGTSAVVGGGSGGGGGASAVGSNGSTAGGGTGGNGGAGTASSISGSSVTYAGGGAGVGYAANGSGGSGGGGNPATAGTANTGGGGGASHSNPGGSGGSGVVIVSYTTGSMTATGGTVTTSGGNTIHTFTSSGTFSVTSPVPPRFRVGNPSGNHIAWDGSTLTIVGNGSGLTSIDGGNITTGTITADQIAAGTITADELSVTELSSITSDMGHITAGDMSIGGGYPDGLTIDENGFLQVTFIETFQIEATQAVIAPDFEASSSVTLDFATGGGDQFLCVANNGTVFASPSACN